MGRRSRNGDFDGRCRPVIDRDLDKSTAAQAVNSCGSLPNRDWPGRSGESRGVEVEFEPLGTLPREHFWLPTWLPTMTVAVVRYGFRRFGQVPVPPVLRDFRTRATRREPGFAVLAVWGSGVESPQLHSAVSRDICLGWVASCVSRILRPLARRRKLSQPATASLVGDVYSKGVPLPVDFTPVGIRQWTRATRQSSALERRRRRTCTGAGPGAGIGTLDPRVQITGHDRRLRIGQ